MHFNPTFAYGDMSILCHAQLPTLAAPVKMPSISSLISERTAKSPKSESTGPLLCNVESTLDDLCSDEHSSTPSGLCLSECSNSNLLTTQALSTTNMLYNYCTCGILKNGTLEIRASNSMKSAASNAMCAIMNAKTRLDSLVSQKDPQAEFLFPTVTKLSLKNESKSTLYREETGTQNYGVSKVFKVVKVPKAAFKMIPRKQLARSSPVEEESAQETKPDLISNDFDERKMAFGVKRDDLFYKTIGRDVRKFLQEKFHTFLGARSLKDSTKNGTFLRDAKAFYSAMVAPLLLQGCDSHEVFTCVATLISYTGFKQF